MATLVDIKSSVEDMAPSTLDLFILTFNCAKNFINVAVFASHLQAALKQNATGLPDLVVFSLQEVAPLSYSFIGGYFLSPYLARYEEALNLAATRYTAHSHDDDGVVSVQPTVSSKPGPYTLVRTRNVGMTAILLFAKDPSALLGIQEAEVGFGAAEMGNKGAVGLRVVYEGAGREGENKSTEITFVATHLAAMEWNLPRRNANWATIMRGLTFENPETVLHPKKGVQNAQAAEEEAQEQEQEQEEEGENVHLLHDEHHAQNVALQERLHDISVFKPSSHLFVAGDLNYRISATSPPPLATFPSLDPESEHHYPRFFSLDQLTRERKAGRTFHGMSEAEVSFPPTYKYNVLPVDETGLPVRSGEIENVPWVFAPHRYPSWTDRILFLEVPPWAKGPDGEKQGIRVKAYDALPVVRMSDHRPVFLRVEVPILSAKEMSLPSTGETGLDGAEERNGMADPRVRLPVALDPEAWERRAAARRREVFVGWSAFLWSTRQGALVLATVLFVGVGGWWLVQAW